MVYNMIVIACITVFNIEIKKLTKERGKMCRTMNMSLAIVALIQFIVKLSEVWFSGSSKYYQMQLIHILMMVPVIILILITGSLIKKETKKDRD